MRDIVIVYPKDNWILQRLGDEIIRRQSQIKWFGHADPTIWHSVDYTLITSRYEGGPMCLLESLACGEKGDLPAGRGICH